MKIVGAILILVGVLLGIAFVPVLFLGSSYPTASLITPLVCGGSGYEIVSETTVNENAVRARNAVQTTMSCRNVAGEETSVSSMLLIIATVPAVIIGVIGFALFNAGAMMSNFGGLGGMKEMQEIAKVPEVKAQLDALAEDFKAQRVSYQDYMVMTKNIIENYKARQSSVQQ